MIVQKEWGSENVLVNNELYCCKIMRVKPMYACSLHKHNIKDETFKLLKGDIRLEVDDAFYAMKVGDAVRIHPGQWHRFSSRHGGVILEVSTSHSDSDVERKVPSGPIHEW